MRSVAELLQHLVESQKFLVGEACRPDTNLLRKSFAENIKDYAPDVRTVNDKEAIIQCCRPRWTNCEKLARQRLMK